MISQAVAKTYLDSIAKSKYPDAELEKTDTSAHSAFKDFAVRNTTEAEQKPNNKWIVYDEGIGAS